VPQILLEVGSLTEHILNAKNKMILTVATIDYIDHLKKHSKGWTFEPLVSTVDKPLKHEQYLTAKSRPNHISPCDFYLDHQQKGPITLVKATKPGHYPRLIELRLDQGPTAKMFLRYWRINGWKQNQVSYKWNSIYSRKHIPVQQFGEVNFRTYAMDRVVKGSGKRKSVIHRDVLDLAVVDSADTTAQSTMATLEKSLKKSHGGGRREKLRKWTLHLAIVMDGRNYHYDGYQIHMEVRYEGQSR